jgi:hypothetical protein
MPEVGSRVPTHADAGREVESVRGGWRELKMFLPFHG